VEVEEEEEDEEKGHKHRIVGKNNSNTWI